MDPAIGRVMRLRNATVVVAAGLLLAGCTSPDPEPEEPTATQDAQPEETEEPQEPLPELEQPYPLGDVSRDFPDAIGSLTTDEGHEFSLTGVHPLASDRVVVTGYVDFEDMDNADFSLSPWEEPGFRFGAGGTQFAALELTVPDDPRTYLPVRNADDVCLCSVIRSGFQTGGPTMPVMMVLSAPDDIGSVDLTWPDVGEFTDVEVTPIPEQHTAAWGIGQVVSATEATRADGVITARMSVGTTEDTEQYGIGVFQFGSDQTRFAGIAATAGSTGTWSEEDRYGAMLPSAGEGVDFEATFPDPGTDDIVLLPFNGFPLTAPIDGEASEGSGEAINTYSFRTKQEGASIAQDEDSVEILLDTTVLFDENESTLTSDAEQTLELAAEQLRAQDGRSVTIDGHTDTQGGAQYNLDLSLARAEAVRDALEPLLGDGWDFEVNGYGYERTLVDERGTPEEIAAAQARNRRVEVTVES